MGFSFKLSGFPLLIMAILILISNSGAAQANGTTVPLVGNGAQANANVPNFTCGPTTACFPTSTLPSPSTITCQSSSGDCELYVGCTSPVPAGAFCVYTLFIIPTFTAFRPGTTIYVDTGGNTQSSSSSNTSTFAFGAIGPAGFIVMISVAIGVAVLAGITVFGSSGGNQESIHILFQGGLLLGLWAIMTAAEGFVSGTDPFFTALNGAFNPLGTSLYIMLSLVYVLGTISSISRGGTN